jgi:hypothetical protein
MDVLSASGTKEADASREREWSPTSGRAELSSCTTTAFAFYPKFVPSISSFFIFFFTILKNGERIYAYDY